MPSEEDRSHEADRASPDYERDHGADSFFRIGRSSIDKSTRNENYLIMTRLSTARWSGPGAGPCSRPSGKIAYLMLHGGSVDWSVGRNGGSGSFAGNSRLPLARVS